MVDNINANLKATAAYQIAKKLDKADGNEDGKIDVSIWNSFVADKGGNKINNFISIRSAMNSITTYLAKTVRKTKENVNNLAQTWLNNATNDPNPPQADTNPPQKDTNPPQKDDNPPATKKLEKAEPIKVNPDLKNKTVTNKDGSTIEYDSTYILYKDKNGNKTKEIYNIDEDGSCNEEEYDEKGNMTKYIVRDTDGNVTEYIESEYDEKGNNTKDIHRYADGNVTEYIEYEYDENNNMTKEIHRDAEGNVTEYKEYEYDENNNNTKNIYRDAEGNVTVYVEEEYDEKGNNTKNINRDADGKVTKYTEFVYTKDGSHTGWIFRNPDGTIKEE